MRVERGERLVEEEDAGVTGERTSERDALALAARDRARARARKARDPEALEELVDAVAPAEGDVRPHGQVREERVFLEDEADAAPFRGKVDASLGVEPGLVSERDPPALGSQQACDRPQHARLARARGPDDRDRLGRDVER
jgi:hypothetical protein